MRTITACIVVLLGICAVWMTFLTGIYLALGLPEVVPWATLAAVDAAAIASGIGWYKINQWCRRQLDQEAGPPWS